LLKCSIVAREITRVAILRKELDLVAHEAVKVGDR
jgi:hypothetical protein